MLKYKRGAAVVSIPILVLLALVLAGAALFSFITFGKGIEAKVYDTGFMEGVYAYESGAGIFLKEAGTNVLEENGKENFKTNLIKEIARYSSEEYKDIDAKVASGDFEVTENGEKIVIKVSYEKRAESENKEISVIHQGEIVVELPLNKEIA